MIGLKIWSQNIVSYPKLVEFYENKLIDYIELYIVPGTFDENKHKILKKIPIIFHAPNFRHNFRIIRKDDVYRKAMKDVRAFTKFFGEKRIIFHPGYISRDESADKNDVIAVVKELKKEFQVILETMPVRGIEPGYRFAVSSYEDFRDVLDKTGIDFCVDFSHVIAAARHYKVDPIELLRKYIELKPFMYHICDSDYDSPYDSHQHFGDGSFPLKQLASLLPEDAIISLETPKSDFEHLSEDKKNLKILKNLLSVQDD